ncbi:hypothetical protein IAU60_000372 [Kwoniella sp. DSM 27419]
MLSKLILLAVVCATAYASPAKRDSILPPIDPNVTIVPDSASIPGHRIRFDSRRDLCLQGRHNQVFLGNLVQVGPCETAPGDMANATSAQLFQVDAPTAGSIGGQIKSVVRPGSPDLCLYTQDGSPDGGQVIFGKCDDKRPSMDFVIETQSLPNGTMIRIRSESGNQCLDAKLWDAANPTSKSTTDFGLQTWECHAAGSNDNNQWFFIDGPEVPHANLANATVPAPAGSARSSAVVDPIDPTASSTCRRP